ncbi:MAG: phosphate ABC transporter permease PstA [Nitrospirae bacterium]|nr:phosphate ABC transporter permease PstA [Nitrospirota bacterium]MBI3595155.1 phosphate ABC transporter permease PstA [Nitrospirota bacterium]
MTSAFAIRRKMINYFMLFLTGLSSVLVISILFFILGYIVFHGIGSFSPAFFTHLPKPVGESGGGMANAIVGSLKLMGLAGLMGIPLGFMGGLYLSEYGKKNVIGFCVRYAADLMNSIPSIVIGIFAYILIVLPMGHFSLLSGGIALGIMLIPIMVRNSEEFLKLVPDTIREAALALGLPEWKMVIFIVIPSASRGIVTGIMLGLARISGETAPLLFTAFGNQYWNRSLFEPVSSLPVMIYTYAISPYEEWHKLAWTAGMVLLLLILGMNIISRWIFQKRLG